MKKPCEEAKKILSVAIVNGEIDLKDIGELLSVLMPLFPKEECENPAD